jgi:hypothetical protein
MLTVHTATWTMPKNFICNAFHHLSFRHVTCTLTCTALCLH